MTSAVQAHATGYCCLSVSAANRPSYRPQPWFDTLPRSCLSWGRLFQMHSFSCRCHQVYRLLFQSMAGNPKTIYRCYYHSYFQDNLTRCCLFDDKIVRYGIMGSNTQFTYKRYLLFEAKTKAKSKVHRSLN